MSRGPRSLRAIDAAMPVASRRGEVMVFAQRTGSCFDFMTGGPAGQTAVRVDRALRIHGTPAEIAVAHANVIDRMNAAALAPGVSRELWLWAPWGTMRYFRIEGATITELDLLGNIRLPLVKGALAGKKRQRWRKSRNISGTIAGPGPAPGPDDSPVPGKVPQAAGTPAPKTGTGREPAPVRYLRRRAAAMKPKREERPGVSPPPGAPAGLPGCAVPGGDVPPPS